MCLYDSGLHARDCTYPWVLNTSLAVEKKGICHCLRAVNREGGNLAKSSHNDNGIVCLLKRLCCSGWAWLNQTILSTPLCNQQILGETFVLNLLEGCLGGFYAHALLPTNVTQCNAVKIVRMRLRELLVAGWNGISYKNPLTFISPFGDFPCVLK